MLKEKEIRTRIGNFLCKIGLHKYLFVLGPEMSGRRCQRCGKNDIAPNTFPITIIPTSISVSINDKEDKEDKGEKNDSN